jgi:hypothetical protein
MKNSTNRGGAGDIVGKDKETVLAWDDAKTVTFAKTSRSKRSISVIDHMKTRAHLSWMWFWASAA